MIRAFIAFTLPRDIISALIEIQRDLKKLNIPNLHFTRPENLHMTLFFLGNRTKDELNSFASKIPGLQTSKILIKFENIALSCFGSKSQPSVLYASFDDINGYGKMLSLLIGSSLGIKQDKPWRPHITLGRFKNSPIKLNAAILHEIKLPELSFAPERIMLYSSTLTPNGPIYKEFYEFP